MYLIDRNVANDLLNRIGLKAMSKLILGSDLALANELKQMIDMNERSKLNLPIGLLK